MFNQNIWKQFRKNEFPNNKITFLNLLNDKSKYLER